MDANFKSIDIFSGIGGLTIGIGRSGFNHLFGVDNNKACFQTLSCNIEGGLDLGHEWKFINRDIKEINFNQYEGSISLLSGGPPCQPFSFGGNHLAASDSRNMFPEAIRVVREAKPRSFMFENVKGLSRESFSNYFEYIRLQLMFPEIIIKLNETWLEHLGRLESHYASGSDSGLNYRVFVKVLNAADYGVPQYRERVFLVGFRSDITSDWSFPNITHSRGALNLSKLEGEYWDKYRVGKKEIKFSNQQLKLVDQSLLQVEGLRPWNTLRSAIYDLPDPKRHFRKAKLFKNHIFKDGAKMYKGHTGSLLDEPAKTLKAGTHGVPGGENMLRLRNGKVRYFTVRESARLQGFDDEFYFPGSWGQSMKQLGNAVPIQLAETIGRSIRFALL